MSKKHQNQFYRFILPILAFFGWHSDRNINWETHSGKDDLQYHSNFKKTRYNRIKPQSATAKKRKNRLRMQKRNRKINYQFQKSH